MRELFFLITLALSVAIGFAACGDDDEKTDMPIEMSGDTAVVETDGSEAEADAEAGDGGADGSDAVVEEAEAE